MRPPPPGNPNRPRPEDHIRASLGRVAREACGRSFSAFCSRYLRAHFSLPASSMHQDMFAMLQGAAGERGARMALAAPRGHAKSTIVSLAYPLWCALYGHERFIVIISHTVDQAKDHLSHIKREMEANALLLRDFPDTAGPPTSPPWRRSEIVTRGGTKIIALGAGSQIRGRRHSEARPGLIILDDVEHESMVRSEEQRKQLAEWHVSAVSKAGTGTTNLVVVGTVLHPASLLAVLTDPDRSPGWISNRYKAVISFSERADLWTNWAEIYSGLKDHEGRKGPEAARAYIRAQGQAAFEGTKVLWPEREDYEELMITRQREGFHSFSTEKQNEPLNPQDCLFKESDFHYWDEEFSSEQDLISRIGGECIAFGACDPSLGREGKGRDDTAIITVLKHRKTGVRYVVGADIRKRSPDDIISAVIAAHRRFNYRFFGFEITQFQSVLADLLIQRSRAQGLEVPVFKINHSTDKLARIQRIQPIIANGGVLFSRRHMTLLDQLRQIPMGAHDDGPDALEMVMEVAEYREPCLRWVDLETGQVTESRRSRDPTERRRGNTSWAENI